MSDPGPSLHRPWRALVSAAAAGVLIVVAVVLPVEYALDPLGTGEWLGLVYLGDAGPAPLSEQSKGYRRDEIRFVLERQSVEYKYQLERDAALVFEWRASGEVISDLHAQPATGPPGFAERFDLRRGHWVAGSYQAPFTGLHGWFWENRGRAEVVVELRTAGFYSTAFEFRDGDAFEVQLQP